MIPIHSEMENHGSRSMLSNVVATGHMWPLSPWNVVSSTWDVLLVLNTHWILKTSVSSVQFSCSIVSESLWPHELQHARPPCPSPTPGVHSDSRPLSRWCHPAISSSLVPFSSFPQSLPASESFPMSQLFAWGGQSTGVSTLASFLPKNTQDWSLLEWTGWTSLQSMGLSKSLLQHHSSKASILWYSAFFTVQLSHPYLTTGKLQPWLDGPLLAK